MSLLRRRILMGGEPNELYLYNRGDICSSVTGGYSKVGHSAYTHWSSVTTSDPVYNATNMQVNWGKVGKTREYGNGCATINAIDITNYKTVHYLGYQSTSNQNNASFNFGDFLDYSSATGRYKYDPQRWVNINSRTSKEFTIDISDLTGAYHFGMYGDFYASASGTITLEAMWLTKD